LKKFTQRLFILLFLFSAIGVHAQKKGSLTAQELEKYKQQVTSLVKYVEGTLNFLGDPSSVVKEKEIIINESYLKMFLNDKVQVEDDLDENREVPLYKDVQAYLKDIGFFYRRVKFEFVIADITHFVNEQDKHYFKVTFNRSLSGTTVTGDSVSSRKVRYMEVNLDVNANALKIASIYTTKLDEKEETRVWWNNLSLTWKAIFGNNVFISDSIELSDVVFFADSLVVVSQKTDEKTVLSDSTVNYQIVLPDDKKIDSVDLAFADTFYFDEEPIYTKLKGILKQLKIDVSNNHEINNLSPLTELTELREINCSNTLVTDLFPIRNLNHLELLNCSETPVDDISPLYYSNTLKELNCGYTLISDLSPISGLVNLENLRCDGIKITNLDFVIQMKNLKSLDCSNTRIYDLNPLTELKALEDLDISGTSVINLSTLKELTNLTYLNCEKTSVSSLEPLIDLPKLEVLRISNTSVTTLETLNEADSLKRIYCDNTEIPKSEAIQFMRDNPECLVIFESEDLFLGWKELENPWKEIVRKNAQISEQPTQEELHQVLTVDKLDISGNKEITTLNPIKRLFNLTVLNVSSTNLKDFTPISEVMELEDLNISNNTLSAIDFLSKSDRLHVLNIENTQVASLSPLEKLTNLKTIYADNTGINDSKAFQFKVKNRNCLVVYKTGELEGWWKSLPVAWKNLFSSQFKIDSPPTKEQLHHILFLDSLVINDNSQINDLSPLTIMKGLKNLTLAGTQVSSLQPLSQLTELEVFQCNQNPVSDLTPLSGLTKLLSLDIENTPVSDLESIAVLLDLRSLNASGTQLKSIDPVESLIKLEEIKLNNTLIKSLKPLLELPRLKSLECYNTKITSKTVDKFKEAKPGCKVVYY
jgi:Leucine-rich repeat (LRR) protein